MSDLSLNHQGVTFSRNQRRISDFLKKFCAKVACYAEFGDDNYVAPVLINTDVLERLCYHIGVYVTPIVSQVNFTLFQEEAPKERVEKFYACIFALCGAAGRIQNTSADVVDCGSYEPFVNQFTRVLETIQQVENLSLVDFNADAYLIDFYPNDAEIKLAINVLGTQVIAVADNNKYLDKDNGIFRNNLWAFYIMCIFGGFGLQVTTKNIYYYAYFIGATASQTTNLTTYFNLVQLFSSVFWLWMSDIIGRKAVQIIVYAIYAVACGLMNLATMWPNHAYYIAYMQGIRALTGLAAVLAPLGFVIITDLAPPKNRGIVTVLLNVGTQIGSVISSVVTVYLGTGKPYDTRQLVSGSVEFNQRNIKSYIDANYWSMATFIVSTVFTIFFFKESHPRIIALRKLKKLGITPPKTEYTKAEPMWRVFLQMCKNRDIVLLFFAYWINMIGATNSRTGAQVFTSKMYGFTDVNYAKSYGNTAYIVSITLGVVLTLVATKWMIKTLGEVRVIILSQYTSIIESLINFAIDMPMPKWVMYITLCLTSLTLVFCDSIFLQLVSMYTIPQNRGYVLGIFQLGNSIGRTLSGFLTGVMFDYNIRDAQLYNCLFAGVCLLLLALVRPPLQRTEMDAAAKRMREQEIALSKV